MLSSRSFPILYFFKEKLSDRSNPITFSGHLCKLKLVPFYMLTPPTPSPVAEHWRCSPPPQLGSFSSMYKEKDHHAQQCFISCRKRGNACANHYTYGNYHTQTLASFTGILKVLSPLQRLFSYTISVFTCSHPFWHQSCSKQSITFFLLPSDDGRFSLPARIAALC